MADKNSSPSVLIIGAGPAGLFAARKLAAQGVHVALINRDIIPGGMAEYGIFYKKYRMKEMLRNQFRQIIEMPEITYLGNVTIGEGRDLEFGDLKTLGFDAILVTAGAQGTKWLGLPGEDLVGVHHAKELVYYTNKLPPFSEQKLDVSGKIALIGAGNVMADVARWLIHDLKVKEITVFVRRGPGEVKFSIDGLGHIAANLDAADLENEFIRCDSRIASMGEDGHKPREFFQNALTKADTTESNTRLRFRFFSRPVRILGNSENKVTRIEIEDTKPILENGGMSVSGMGTFESFDVNHVIYCVGDTVDAAFGLPVNHQQFVTNPKPEFPINDISYEAFDAQSQSAMDGVFVAGWSRKASSGLVGLARKDSECAVSAILQYLSQKHRAQICKPAVDALMEQIIIRKIDVVSKDALFKLEEIEEQNKAKAGLKEFKFATNKEMLAAIHEKR